MKSMISMPIMMNVYTSYVFYARSFAFQVKDQNIMCMEREANKTLPCPIVAPAASWSVFICGSLVLLASTMLFDGAHLTNPKH